MIYSFFRCLEAPALSFTFIYDTIPLSSFVILAFTSIFLSSPAHFYPHFLEHFEKSAAVDPIISPVRGVFIIARSATFLPCSSMLTTAMQSLTMIRLHDHGKLFFIVSPAIVKVPKPVGL